MNVRSRATSMGYCGIGTVVAGIAALFLSGSVDAAPINYGDFSDIPPGAVIYLDVTETASTPDDDEPLFGAPKAVVDAIEFEPDPARFGAANSTGEADETTGRLRFGLTGNRAVAITRLSLGGGGIYNLSGPGSALIEYEIALDSVIVNEIDGMPVSSPVVLPGGMGAGSDELLVGVGEEDDTAWDLTLNYDVNEALTAAGVMFHTGATSITVAMEMTLGASGDTVTTSNIGASEFVVRSATEAVPSPASASVLVGVGAAQMIRRRRRGV